MQQKDQKRTQLRQYIPGMRRIELLIGAGFLIIGLNMMIFPSSAVTLFLAGITLRGLFSILKYVFTRQPWDLFFSVLSFIVIAAFIADNSGGIVIALAFWACAWGTAKTMKAIKQKQKGRKRWLSTIIGGCLIIVLSIVLLIGGLAADTFVGYTSMVTGLTFAVLGLTSIIALKITN